MYFKKEKHVTSQVQLCKQQYIVQKVLKMKDFTFVCSGEEFEQRSV